MRGSSGALKVTAPGPVNMRHSVTKVPARGNPSSLTLPKSFSSAVRCAATSAGAPSGPFRNPRNLTVGDRTEENVMWSYREPYEEMLEIKDYMAFYWDRMESWWEEDEEIFRHARDPWKRVDTMLSHRPVKVVVGGEVVAATTNARFLFETNHPLRYYIPAEDVRMDLLIPSDTISQCPYKGIASYHNATIGGETHDDIAWYYPDPSDAAQPIKDHIAFWKGVEVLP